MLPAGGSGWGGRDAFWEITMTKSYENTGQTQVQIEVLVVLAILVSLGFPGGLTEIYGTRLGDIMEYGAFFIQLLVMALSSGKSWQDIQVVNLDKKYVMLYAFAAVIFLESMMVTRYRSLQFITCTRLWVTIFFAIWVQERFSFARVIELICTAQAVFVFFILAFILRHPQAAFESGSTYVNALKGLYPSKNSMASELAFGILVMAFLVREKRKSRKGYSLWMTILLIQGILMILCQATGAVFGMAAALILLFLPEDMRLPLGWAYIGGSITFLFAALTLMPHLEWFFRAIGKDATLTGRIPLWNRILVVMMNHHTFTGYGYGMFWRDSQAIALIHAGFHEHSFLGTMTTGAHNMLLEFWLNSGLMGIAAFFAALLYSTRESAAIPQKTYLFASMLLMYLMINGLTERCLGGNYDYKTLSVFLVMALCNNRREHGEKKTKEKEFGKM
jgi:exopolysaccharide production protein ExoQ